MRKPEPVKPLKTGAGAVPILKRAGAESQEPVKKGAGSGNNITLFFIRPNQKGIWQRYCAYRFFLI